MNIRMDSRKICIGNYQNYLTLNVLLYRHRNIMKIVQSSFVIRNKLNEPMK